MIDFQPFGPFKIPLSNGAPDRTRLKDFWLSAEDVLPGITGAIGCYIFAIRAGGGIRPWYVGKTDKGTFKGEVFQPHKLLIYGEVLRARKRGTPLLYFIVRQTPRGKLVKKRANGDRTTCQLEELLIGSSLLRNPNLANKRTTKHFREMRVPGYMNEAPGSRSREATRLAHLLGTKRGA